MVNVKIYSTPTCPFCNQAKEWFKKKGIEFEDINVVNNQKAAEEMVKISGERGVPQILIGNKRLVVGFLIPAIERALKESEEEENV